MFDDEFEILDDDFEGLEDGEQSASPSYNYGRQNKGNKKDSEKIRNATEKNKQENTNQNNGSGNGINNKNSKAPSGGDMGNQFKKAGNVANMTKGMNSDDPEEQKQALKNMGKEAIKPLVRKGVQAATGGVVGTDPVTGKIIDKAVDKVAEDPNVDKLIGDVTEKVQKHKKKAVIPIIIGLCSSIIPIFILIVAVLAPVVAADDLVDNVKKFGSGVLDFLSGRGWCVFTGDCDKQEAEAYSKIVSENATMYEIICGNENNPNIVFSYDFEEELISATVFYDQMVTGVLDENQEELEEYSYRYADTDFQRVSHMLYPHIYKSPDDSLGEAAGEIILLEDGLLGIILNSHFPDWKDEAANIDELKQAYYDKIIELDNEDGYLMSKLTKACVPDYDNYRGRMTGLGGYIDNNYWFTLLTGTDNYSEYTDEYIMEELFSFSNYYTYGDEGYANGQTVVGAGIAGIVPAEILAVSQSPIGEQPTTQTSCYGFYSVNNCTAHGGVDLTSNVASPQIYSIADGVVVDAIKSGVHCEPDWKDGKACSVCSNTAGNMITIKHSVEINGVVTDFYSQYLHLDSVAVSENQKVSKGDLIGIMGNTGCSTGRHLHFNLLNDSRKRYNPEELLVSSGVKIKSGCDLARASCKLR